ncbi:M48 family metallopeptidase [Leisingera sp. M527]|uniref:M48 family metallopeptidase n=1 Tax=unclassified Leisingera TaxID=2614906 RepID=UPI0010118D28|nr:MULTISPECIES: SprT family zinc-dependent metalloprotease [unclassified Leisingera]QAX28425.1 M48 family peptidase [Leisingera sp. NJS204]UWQ29328.1 M48 family metallopeptidase [Leisingera sp. M523]UWQ32159.1 M48 family metallopeptidase [Leisingera sp. M527]
MAEHHLPGNPPVPLTLRRSARARRISLRISSLDGRVTLTLPKSLPERAALAFAEEKADWIRSHLEKHPEAVEAGFGTVLPVDGQNRVVERAPGRRIQLDAGRIAVPGDSPGRVLQRYLKELARNRLAEASDFYAARLGKGYSRLTLRDTRSRWGSCTADGGLMYSWRLILAPPAVLRYVAAHEVAHLQEMNHSSAFWAVVERLYGQYEPPRGWLRENGAGLHRYRFGE